MRWIKRGKGKKTNKEREAKRGGGGKKETDLQKKPASPMVAPMKSTSPIDTKTSARAELIKKIMEEQEEIEKKEEKRRHIRNPIKWAGQKIERGISKFSHAVLVAFATVLSIPITLARLSAQVVGSIFSGISHRMGRFSPLGWKKRINQLVVYSGVNKTQEEITGITVMGGFSVGILVLLGGVFLAGVDLLFAVVLSLLSFACVWIGVYFVLNLMADKRTEEVEGTLPDVLQIISSNIAAGMTPYNALWVSARKEFGALAEEIKIAQKETLGGKPFSEALTDMGKRVRSHVLQRSVRLLIQGMNAGGELPHILQGIGDDLRQMRLLQKEMAANTMSYMLFILFGMLLGAPLLFSVSIEFVDIINKFQPEDIGSSAATQQATIPGLGGIHGGGMMSLGTSSCPRDFDDDGIPDKWEKQHGLNPKNKSDAMSIDPESGKVYIEEYRESAPPLPPSCITPSYLSIFAMIALGSVSFFGSILIGLIRSGKQIAGLKLAPLLVPGTWAMFWLMSSGMKMFFGSLFGG